MTRPAFALSSCAFVFCFLMTACGSGSSTTPPPVSPTFTSTPGAAADEGALYSYELTATSPDNSVVTFALSQSPQGASLTGNSLSWTPTHAQSRVANQFSVTATNASGGSATQSWSVTPSGVVQITAVLTFWTASGSIDQPQIFLANLPYPAALIPQADGSWTRLQGASNADGTFRIPHVPAGYYWLQLTPAANFWTSSNAFDAGRNFIGNTIKTAAQSTTTFDVALSGTDPIQSGDSFSVTSNLEDPLELLISLNGVPGATSLNIHQTINSNEDFSQINTLFFNQYEPVTSGGFTGSAMGASLTQSNLTITNGAVNSVGGVMTPSPKSSVPLSIRGSEWAASFQNVAPVPVAPIYSDYSVSVQPFAPNAIAVPLNTSVGPNLTLLAPSTQSSSGFMIFEPFFNLCGETSGPDSFPPSLGSPPIASDVDYGTLSYGDPFPAAWLRQFQFCQQALVQLPRPNSTATDQFLLTAGQTTVVPTGPVAPLTSPVQSPSLNGANIFQSASLDTTVLKFSWNAPTGTAPVGYALRVFILVPSPAPTGGLGYAPAGVYYTAKTSVTVPFINAGQTYVFLITANVDGGANFESSPFRSKLPIAYSTVISAPIVINPGATAN